MLHLKKNPKNTTKQIKIYKLKKQKAKKIYALQNQKIFLWRTKQIKTKKNQKAKIFYELQNKKLL